MAYNAKEVFGKIEDKKEVQASKETCKSNEQIESCVADSVAQNLQKNQIEFKTGLSSIDEQVVIYKSHTVSRYSTVLLYTLFADGFLLSYAGIPYTAFYLYDFSGTSTGKTTNKKNILKQKCSYVIEVQKAKISDYQKRKKEFFENPENKNKIFPQERYDNVIFSSNVTAPSVVALSKHCDSALVGIDEIGIYLDGSLDYGMIELINNAHLSLDISAPSLKSEDEDDKPSRPMRLSFYGATNLDGIQRQKLIKHIKAGLINKGVIVFQAQAGGREELPKGGRYALSSDEQKLVYEDSKAIVEFYKELRTKSDFVNADFSLEDDSFKEFYYSIHDKARTASSDGSIIDYLYSRTVSSVKASILILHYRKCFEKRSYTPKVAPETITLGIRLFDEVIEPQLFELQHHFLEIPKQERISKLVKRVVAKVEGADSNLQARDICKNYRLTRAEFDEIFVETGVFKMVGNTIEAVNTKVANAM